MYNRIKDPPTLITKILEWRKKTENALRDVRVAQSLVPVSKDVTQKRLSSAEDELQSMLDDLSRLIND